MKIYFLPDMQIKPWNEWDYLAAYADHIAEERPDYLIIAGDWWDMPSLSSYDRGKRSADDRNYQEDIESGNAAMSFLMKRIRSKWRNFKKKCKRVFLKGNHEDRINKALEYGDGTLRTLIENHKPDYSDFSRVVPFLKVFTLRGVSFSHFFPNENSGRPITSARAILNKKHVSSVAGHQQGFDYCEQLTGDGRTIHAIIAGSAYLHDEDYKGPNNHHFRGSLILNNVKNGMFDLHKYSLKHLMEKYTNGKR